MGEDLLVSPTLLPAGDVIFDAGARRSLLTFLGAGEASDFGEGTGFDVVFAAGLVFTALDAGGRSDAVACAGIGDGAGLFWGCTLPATALLWPSPIF